MRLNFGRGTLLLLAVLLLVAAGALAQETDVRLRVTVEIEAELSKVHGRRLDLEIPIGAQFQSRLKDF